MYPINDNEWLGIKSDPVEEAPTVGNVSRSWQWRERGIDPPNYPSNKTVFENIAEDILVQKPLQTRSCDLPGYPRSTFLMVFSPDGTKVASTHGNHNVYVSELASGKHVRILKGHPRTPWCIAFHPSHPQLIGSGCLGGQVRVWDIASGGSEVWNVRSETVIASIAFHPREQLLVIATYNELYFWDWSHPAPFTKVSTNNVNEKVRYVAFDSLGYKLITGISLWATSGGSSNPIPTPSSGNGGSGNSGTGGTGGTGGSGGTEGGRGNGGNMGSGGAGGTRGSGGAGGEGEGAGRGDDDPTSNRSTESPGEAQDMIVNSYQTLVQRYDSLVRNYQRLFMVRHRLSNTPPPPNMIDRGTDPMESYPWESDRWRRVSRRYYRAYNNDNYSNPLPSTSRQQDSGENGEGESSNSRFLNLDILSFDNDSSRTQDSTRDRSPFGSRSSAFQPLNDSGRTFRTVDQRERTRLLPNPFSSRSGYTSPQSGGLDLRGRRFTLTRTESSTDLHSSRTSILFSPRSAATPYREFALRRRNPPNSSPRSNPSSAATADTASTDPAEPVPSPFIGSSPPVTPATTNSSTQMSPEADHVDAQSINESLDLIRDILRDSGTRLLNLITNMSMNLLTGRHREGNAEAARRRSRVRHLLPSDIYRDFLFSSSDSEGDANILRTPNSAFRENEAVSPLDSPGPSTREPDAPTDRMVFDLEDESLVSDRFRVRTQSGSREAAAPCAPPEPNADPPPEPNAHPPPAADFDPNAPSTSRDPHSTSESQNISSSEAFRRVRLGVHALQRHTFDLGHMWLRGVRLTMPQLRNMWEDLRRRILSIQRELGSERPPGYYTRTLLERCMILTDMSSTGHSSSRRNNSDASTSTSNTPETESSAPKNPRLGTRATLPRSPNATRSPLFRRRLQCSHRLRPESETQEPRRCRQPSRPVTTRHEIRMRAMQVLSMMFNMMMMCIEERGLSEVIMQMLRALKKSLALSCFMIMGHRPVQRSSSNSASTSQNVVRIQNAEHTGPVNVDGPDDPASPRVNPPNDERTDDAALTSCDATKTNSQSTSQAAETDTQTNDVPSPARDSNSQRWSRRLAVQIAVANRNTSMTARTRRDLYLECKRQKALHRTNPGVHPLVKRRFPPVSGHRIPTLRSLPRRLGTTPRTPPTIPASAEPVAGPSNAAPADNSNSEPPRGEMNEFDNRVNLIRIAHMQAVRLRNAARNRFRRLQTIRFYTPSSVFALQSNNSENQQDNESLPPTNEESRRRSFVSYGPHVVPRADPAAGPSAREPAAYHAVLNSVAMPLMPVSELAQAAEAQAQGNQAHRPPRIHEYLQPIILAQNAMVVEDDGDGGGGAAGGLARRMGGMAGMAGLLDAGIISDALPAPCSRVQAWDFTTGQTPDIADNTKNLVVQKCRIHNDASIDISKDGRLLVALLPVTRLRNTNSWLGVYSLEWERLGQCLHTAMLEQSAVSVALSPTARYLAVGLGSRRFSSAPHARPTNVIALLYKLDPAEYSSRSGLSPIKELMQQWEHNFTSLNCLRWAPQPGQGLVYANNTGQLIIMS